MALEKNSVSILRADNKKLKELAVKTVNLKNIIIKQATFEQEEEYISNKLLQNIRELKLEKIQLLQQVEKEEEYLIASF